MFLCAGYSISLMLICMCMCGMTVGEDPFIRFLMKKMDELGCTITEEYFTCRQCPRKIFGFFDTQLGVRFLETSQCIFYLQL
jgi:hypothetical protein